MKDQIYICIGIFLCLLVCRCNQPVQKFKELNDFSKYTESGTAQLIMIPNNTHIPDLYLVNRTDSVITSWGEKTIFAYKEAQNQQGEWKRLEIDFGFCGSGVRPISITSNDFLQVYHFHSGDMSGDFRTLVRYSVGIIGNGNVYSKPEVEMIDIDRFIKSRDRKSYFTKHYVTDTLSVEAEKSFYLQYIKAHSEVGNLSLAEQALDQFFTKYPDSN